jgi:hypothetical protein
VTPRTTTAGVAAALTLAALSACGGGGGGAKSDAVGARKAACNNAPDFSLVSFRATALPPEPVEELLPKAKFVVEARVARVLYQGDTPDRESDENLAGPIPPARCQVVQLDVTQELAGNAPGSSVTVVKPLAPYVLKPGQRTDGVAFLVEGADPFPIILGRYGPYPLNDVDAALHPGQ